MSGDAVDRFGKVVVDLINGSGFRISGFDSDLSGAVGEDPQLFADGCIIGNVFRQNILCAGNGFLQCLDAFFRIDIAGSFFHQPAGLLLPDQSGKGSQPSFPGDGSPGLPFGPVGPVEVFQLR